MKSYPFFLYALMLISASVSAQEDEARLLYGAQLRVILPGVEPYIELPVARNLVLRSEVSLTLGYAFTSIGRNESGFGLSLDGTLSPRWYYNYEKRRSRGKSVYRNSANFVSLRATFIPGTVVAQTSDALSPISGFTIIPSWGLRRPVGKLVFEASAGLGFRRTGEENEPNTSGGAISLRVGIGF